MGTRQPQRSLMEGNTAQAGKRRTIVTTKLLTGQPNTMVRKISTVSPSALLETSCAAPGMADTTGCSTMRHLTAGWSLTSCCVGLSHLTLDKAVRLLMRRLHLSFFKTLSYMQKIQRQRSVLTSCQWCCMALRVVTTVILMQAALQMRTLFWLALDVCALLELAQLKWQLLASLLLRNANWVVATLVARMAAR